MLVKPITYINYYGEEVTEDYYFNINEAELTEMEMTTGGGFGNLLKKVVSSKDKGEIFSTFKDIVLKSYGEKSSNGKYFYKKDKDGTPLAAQFEQTEAYNVLLMELCFDADAASAFVNGVFPKNLEQMMNRTAKPAAGAKAVDIAASTGK